MKVFEQCCEKIKGFYDEHPGLDQGFRFLLCPSSRLTNHNGVMIIGLNPGPLEDPTQIYSVEEGCSFLVEDWPSPMGDEILRMSSRLSQKIPVLDSDQLLEDALCTNFIPFRSAGFDRLAHPDECVEFAQSLWEMVLGHDCVPGFHSIICIGNGKNSSYRYMVGLLERLHRLMDQWQEPIRGPFSMKWSRIESDSDPRLIAGLPHLARVPFFTSEKFEVHSDRWLDLMSEHLKQANLDLE